MRNCIIAVFCSYVNRLRQYCCIIRKNGARPWLLVGKGRRDAGNGKQRSRLHSRLSQSLRRSYNRLGDPQLLRRLWEKRAFCSRPANRRGADTFQMTSLCGKAAACQRSRFIHIPAHNGFARLLQKAAEARHKARAGRAEGQKNTRKGAQDGAASRCSKEYGALCALLFARLLYDSLRLCRAAKPQHRFSAPPRASRAARRPTAFAADSAAKAVQFHSTGTRSCAVGFDSADISAFFRRRSLNTKQIGRIGSQKKDVSCIYYDIRI